MKPDFSGIQLEDKETCKWRIKIVTKIHQDNDQSRKDAFVGYGLNAVPHREARRRDKRSRRDRLCTAGSPIGWNPTRCAATAGRAARTLSDSVQDAQPCKQRSSCRQQQRADRPRPRGRTLGHRCQQAGRAAAARRRCGSAARTGAVRTPSSCLRL